jgi:hypothetical protein
MQFTKKGATMDNEGNYSHEAYASIKRGDFACSSCGYWRPHKINAENVIRGRCIFGAPNYTLVMAQNNLGGNPSPLIVTFWRETSQEDACSEWSMVGGETQGFIKPQNMDA